MQLTIQHESGHWYPSIGRKFSISVNRKALFGRRLSYALFKGDLPEDRWVCVSCTDHRCINPEHLYLAGREGRMLNGLSCKNDNENKKIAIASGGTKYLSNRPCRRGHEGMRWVASGKCCECEKIKDESNDRKNYSYKSAYGLSYEQVCDLKLSTLGICPICKLEVQPLDMHVDHCHATGKIRGAICQHCNRGLGLFKDKISSLKNAISYLRKYGAKS